MPPLRLQGSGLLLHLDRSTAKGRPQAPTTRPPRLGLPCTLFSKQFLISVCSIHGTIEFLSNHISIVLVELNIWLSICHFNYADKMSCQSDKRYLADNTCFQKCELKYENTLVTQEFQYTAFPCINILQLHHLLAISGHDS